MAGTESGSSNTTYDQNGNIMGYQWGLGDMQSPNMKAPGSIDPMTANPYIGSQISDMQNLRGEFGQSVTNNYMNPAFYDQMKAQSGDQLTSRVNNQYARMGLSGSSANAGSVTQGLISNDQQWRERQLSDQLRAMQGQSMLDNNINSMISGVQNQYGGWQNSIVEQMMGIKNSQNQQSAANDQLWGSIIGGTLQGGGSAAGGAMTAAALA